MSMDFQKNKIIEITPKLLTILLMLLLILPALSLVVGFDLGFTSQLHNTPHFYAFLYRWSISIIAMLIVLLSFTDYWGSRNGVVFIVGIAYLFAVYFNTLFTVFYEGLYFRSLNIENLHAYIWFISNGFVGLLLSFGITILLTKMSRRMRIILQLLLFLILTMGCSFWLESIVKSNSHSVATINSNLYIIHPLALINFLIYGYIIYLSPKVYKLVPSIVSRMFFYLGIVQCIMSLYILLGVMKSYDAAYIGSSFLQLFSYFLVFFSLLSRYILDYFFIIQQQKKIHEDKDRFEQLSYQDPLTNLANRRSFELEVEREIAGAKRQNYQFVILYLDLDYFKTVNDTLGHLGGDELLQQVAQRLKHSLRLNDYCARLGGDEFGVILSETHSNDEIKSVIEKLNTVLLEPYSVQGKTLLTGTSLGMAIYPRDGNDFETLLKNADTAMYEAKKGKKAIQVL